MNCRNGCGISPQRESFIASATGNKRSMRSRIFWIARPMMDHPAMYWKRCQEYLFDEPPVGWDGVFTMTHK